MNLSSIYGLVPVGWVERSSKVCHYSSNRTLLFSRRVLKICQVKPNALRPAALDRWVSLYLSSTVHGTSKFCVEPKGSWAFTALPNLRVHFYFLGLTQQASVRRGPRASATSLFTVSLAESEASAFLPNRVCVSPISIIELTLMKFANQNQ